MEQEKKERLRKAGVNLPRGINGFMGNEGLYEGFLLKFPLDKNMDLLKAALLAEETETAFHGAHTLLGLAANLSMEVLSAALRPVTEALREGDLALAKENMAHVEAAYDAIMEALEE